MFGSGYQIRESSQLPCGKYRARICKSEFVNRNGYEMLVVYLDISGHPNCKPNEISYFDRPTSGEHLEELQASWDVKMTTFFNAFNLQPGNWNIQTWLGAIGEVVCFEDKKNNQYRVLRPVYENAGVKQNQNNQQMAQRAQQNYNGNNQYNFENIPF